MPLSQRNCARSWQETLPWLYACDAYVQLGADAPAAAGAGVTTVAGGLT
jgi:hypothetical protein